MQRPDRQVEAAVESGPEGSFPVGRLATERCAGRGSDPQSRRSSEARTGTGAMDGKD